MKETILMQAAVCGAAPAVEQAEISEAAPVSSRFTYPGRLSRLETLVAKSTRLQKGDR